MKKLISILFVAVAVVLCGCQVKLANIPNASFSSWTHDGNYGVFSTHVEAHNAAKQADGKIVVGAYTGAIKVLGGYGPSDTITNLVIDPAEPSKTTEAVNTALTPKP